MTACHRLEDMPAGIMGYHQRRESRAATEMLQFGYYFLFYNKFNDLNFDSGMPEFGIKSLIYWNSAPF